MRIATSLALASWLLTGCAIDGDDPDYAQDEALELSTGSGLPPLAVDVRTVIDRQVAEEHARLPYTGLSVVVIRDGVAYQGHFGEAVVGTGARPNGTTLYAIGSVTKTFTGTLLALFDRRDYLDWNDKLTSHMTQELSGGREDITLRHLALHRAGLPEDPPGSYKTATYAGDMAALREALASCTTTCTAPVPDDQEGEYSNWGFALLADVVASSVNRTIANAFRTYFFDPLGMSSTRYKYELVDTSCLVARTTCGYSDYGDCSYKSTCNSSFNPRAAVGYHMVGGTPTRSGSGTGSNQYVKAGSGVLWSTPTDMSKWLGYQMNVGGTNSTEAEAVLLSARTPRTPSELAFLGKYQTTGEGHRYMRKVGYIDNQFKTFFGFTDDRKLGVVVLSNNDSFAVTPLGESLIDALR